METDEDKIKVDMVDDLYWLAKGKSFIEDSLVRLADEIRSLSTLANAIEVTYSISAFLTIYFAKFEDNWGWHLFFYCIPILVFELSKYWLKLAHIQKAVNFNYRSPSDIRRAYNQSFNYAYKNLQYAKWMYLAAVLSSFTVIVGEVVYKVTNKAEEIEVKQYFTADWHEDSDTILLAGRFHGAQKMKLAIRQEIKIDTSLKISQTDPRLTHYHKYEIIPFILGEEHLFISRFVADSSATLVEFIAKYQDSLSNEKALIEIVMRD